VLIAKRRNKSIGIPMSVGTVTTGALKRLPKAIRESAVSMIERKLETGTVTDLVTISDTDWHQACRRFNAIQRLAEQPGRLGKRVKEIGKMFGATDRTVRRWLSVYRSNPDIVSLLPRQRGQRLGNRTLTSVLDRGRIPAACAAPPT
jgi:hypothetical protein